MENLENNKIEFFEKIKRYYDEYDREFKELSELEKNELNQIYLESWENTIFLTNLFEKINKDISITKGLTSIRKSLIHRGISLPKATYIVLQINLEINIEREKKISELEIEEIGSISDDDLKKQKIEFDLLKSLAKMKFDDIDFTRADLYYDVIKHAKSFMKLNSIKDDDLKKEITLNSFFFNTVSDEIINDIQTTFCYYKGMQMAILISLLQTEFSLTNIIPNDKEKSLKRFVSLLKKIDYSDIKLNGIMSAVNKQLNLNENGMIKTFVKSNTIIYHEIHKNLTEILEKKVV